MLPPELVSRIITGLVFAQRPIATAGQSLTERHDLGPRGAFMLSLIGNGVLYPNDLATLLRIGRSLVTAELSRLTEAGLVASEPDDDRRRTRLTLTPLGICANATFRTAIIRSIEENLAGYSLDQVKLFATMLLKVQAMGGTA
jgi:DNA-binding MarR family transcriptional regulator